jgi:hypothetical protein
MSTYPSFSRIDASDSKRSEIDDNRTPVLASDIFLVMVDHTPSKELISDIKKTAEKQKIYKSKHKYDLKKFGLSEKKIKKDCLPIYETFLT